MAYEPKQVEDRIYAGWLTKEYFRAAPGRGKPYCITIPPPNITGSLHIGHALNNSVLDAMTRWHRMRGYNTLCLPGTDHAGIATQNVVERELAKEGKTRHDVGREAFIERCWEWRRLYGDRIYLQLQKLGCSFDWSRARFTMDESYVDAIHEEFIRWWERGLIYRGARVVNWCPRCRSAISDIEVDSEERAGKLYHFRYPLAPDSISQALLAQSGEGSMSRGPSLSPLCRAVGGGQGKAEPEEGPGLRAEPGDEHAAGAESGEGPGLKAESDEGSALRAESAEGPALSAESEEGPGLRAESGEGPGLKAESAEGPSAKGYITIATTRPETMLGDSAVAVNPADPRYQGLIGRTLRLPLTTREIPIIADDYAKMEFGTGAVKVTPAHDLDDFEAGLRHNLPQHVVIGEDGRMTEAAGPDFAGMDRFDARAKVVAELESLGLVEKVEDYRVKLPLCDRCGTALEPLLSEQWFARMKPELADPAVAAVLEDRIQFVPERYRRIFLDWMERIQPWCISRQLWWGHRIPVWWTSDRRNAAARSAEEAAGKLGVPASELAQDEDVLDTWFSSALWPHATLGWPRDTEDLRFYYPTNLLSTAQEILYLWVARMIMTGLDFVGDIPFRDVYIHATVLDEKGERMSKSKGNGVDPLDMIDRYGADALRFALLQQAGKNQDIRFSEERVRQAGTFINKLWNASRFVLANAEGAGTLPGNGLEQVDRWILSRLHATVEQVNAGLATYDMDDAAAAIYRFLWNDFCDWYIEMAKPRLRAEGAAANVARSVAVKALEVTLRLMHPLIPFVTEEVWQELPHMGDSIMLAEYPRVHNLPAWRDDAAERGVAALMECVRGLRNLRAEMGIAPGARVQAAVVPATGEVRESLAASAALVSELARLSSFELLDSAPAGSGRWVASPVEGADVYLEIGEALDIAKERDRIARELEAVDREESGVRARLSNPLFLEKAASEVIEKTRAQASALSERRSRLESRRALFGS